MRTLQKMQFVLLISSMMAVNICQGKIPTSEESRVVGSITKPHYAIDNDRKGETLVKSTPSRAKDKEENYIVILHPEYKVESGENVGRRMGLNVRGSSRRFRSVNLRGNSKQIDALSKSPLVKQIVKDVPVRMLMSSSRSQIRVNEVHNLGVDGNGVRVCIIDSGMNYHDDLPMPEREYDFVNNDSRADDEDGHGTSMAGILASQHQGSALTSSNSGVAPGVTLLIAKVFGANGSADASVIGSALDWCADQDADIINMSLGHGGFRTSCDDDATAMFANTVANLGIHVVAAAGNDSFGDQIASPACGSKVISVGSVTNSDQHSNFSNQAPILDIVAPGEYVTTTNSGGQYSEVSGTSASTPLVVGVIALLKSLPEAPTHAEIRSALFSGAKDLGMAGKDKTFGYGRVDAMKSYNIIKNGPDDGGGETGGPIVLEFSTSRARVEEEVFSGGYKSSQMTAEATCPAGQFLSSFEVQRTKWGFYRSVSWFNLKCQAIGKLNNSKELGKKRHSGSERVSTAQCGTNEAVTGLNVVYDRFIKDFKVECAKMSYSQISEGAVSVNTHKFGLSYLFNLKQRNDDERISSCPRGTVAVGIEGSAKSDRNEWAFTRLGLRCAEIRTVEKR